MKVILFGASGMVGQGVLRECLHDAGVKKVLSVGRSSSGNAHEKLTDIILSEVGDIAHQADNLRGYDACFFCLGMSAAGMSEARYTALTYDLTLKVANTLLRLNRGMTFIYVSGAGTDSSEKGRVMWARVKGRTENALLRLGFKAAFMLRPAAIQPLHAGKSKTPLYRLIYGAMTPLWPLLKVALPNHVSTTEQIGRAMINLARHGGPRTVHETKDIKAIAEPR